MKYPLSVNSLVSSLIYNDLTLPLMQQRIDKKNLFTVLSEGAYDLENKIGYYNPAKIVQKDC